MNRMNGGGTDVYYIAPCGRRLVSVHCVCVCVCVCVCMRACVCVCVCLYVSVSVSVYNVCAIPYQYYIHIYAAMSG